MLSLVFESEGVEFIGVFGRGHPKPASPQIPVWPLADFIMFLCSCILDVLVLVSCGVDDPKTTYSTVGGVMFSVIRCEKTYRLHGKLFL